MRSAPHQESLSLGPAPQDSYAEGGPPSPLILPSLQKSSPGMSPGASSPTQVVLRVCGRQAPTPGRAGQRFFFGSSLAEPGTDSLLTSSKGGGLYLWAQYLLPTFLCWMSRFHESVRSVAKWVTWATNEGYQGILASGPKADQPGRVYCRPFFFPLPLFF